MIWSLPVVPNPSQKADSSDEGINKCEEKRTSSWRAKPQLAQLK
jgi:hypothetical protein